jgi:endonuclease YncB( thermonuclease family)
MIRAGLLVLLGIASFAAVYVTTAPPEPSASPSAEAEAVSAVAATAETVASDAAENRINQAIAFELRPTGGLPDTGGTAGPPVRNVTPPDMTAAPVITGPLSRVATREDATVETQAQVERLFNPIVVAAGTIKAGGRDIALAGIEAPTFDERCGEGDGVWPCGRMARAALRRFVRGRAIECEVPAGAGALPERATCRVAGEDLAAWLVAQGWAKRDGDLYGEEEDAAREAKLGLWGEGKRAGQADVASSG